VGVVAGGAANLAAVRPENGADQLVGRRVPEQVALVHPGRLAVALAEPKEKFAVLSMEEATLFLGDNPRSS